MVGAAYGDALGWPHEQRASAIRGDGFRVGLFAWEKRSGGRFQPHVEDIEAGAYSDDTQLILAVARCRLSGEAWWRKLAEIELPFWALYERGGGGASLRAARLHMKGVLPWEASDTEQAKYFNAGGNGVAMRILPHVLLDDNFPLIARSVLADGVITHGHPRALVGALAYAYALHVALQSSGTLPFGELIRATLDGVDSWSRLPDLSDFWPTWNGSAEKIDGFGHTWDGATYELYEALKVALRGLDAGALSNDDEILNRLGCFNKNVNGSGTVAAAATLFLTSKHAAAPMEGVVRAATADGADTDTLASMCGGLFGAFAGTSWLPRDVSDLQDLLYIDELGRQLASGAHFSGVGAIYRRKFDVKSADNLIRQLTEGAHDVELPFGVRAPVEPSQQVRSLSRNLAARSWRLSVPNGQSFRVKKLFKENSPSQSRAQSFARQPKLPIGETHSGSIGRISINVANLEASREFYGDILRLPVIEEAPSLMKVGDHLWLKESPHHDPVGGLTVWINVTDLDQRRSDIAHLSKHKVSNITTKAGRRAFACFDPDGYRLEVFENGA